MRVCALVFARLGTSALRLRVHAGPKLTAGIMGHKMSLRYVPILAHSTLQVEPVLA